MAKNKQGGHPNGEGQAASFKLQKIEPLTVTQHHVFKAFHNNNLFLYGVAGTGKSFVPLYKGLREVSNPDSPYRKVYIVRSAVATRDPGFLPGTLNQKLEPYEAPYSRMLSKIYGRGDAYQVCVQKGIVEFISTAFLRGITIENAIVIADEVQNYNFEELDTVITRVGSNCKMIFCGDLAQCDLYRSRYDQTGLPLFIRIITRMNSFQFIEFFPEDIVRGELVKEYILAKLEVEREDEDTAANEQAA